MVMIQVLIAEVALNNTDEFGVELGLQDSVLFDRSLISDLVTTTTVSQNQTGSQVPIWRPMNHAQYHADARPNGKSTAITT